MGKHSSNIFEINTDGVLISVRKCTSCLKIKQLEEYHKKKGRPGGTRSICKQCRHEQELEQGIIRARIWYSKNKDRQRATNKNWKLKNEDKVKEGHLKRRAFKKQLPSNVTSDYIKSLLDKFDGKCALTGEICDIHIDHVIPLATGHVGNVVGNIIPLKSCLNISKSDFNLFEWYEKRKEEFNLTDDRFNDLIDFLAKENGLSNEEYRRFVYWCHKNKRNIHEIESEGSEPSLILFDKEC